jgi:hypothetical protein
MAVLAAYSASARLPDTANLSTAQAGNGQATNVIDRGARVTTPAVLVVTSAIGATPTCTYLIEVSVDNANWFPGAYADSATPETVSVATWVETTAVTRYKILRVNHPWRYLRLTYSANTNVTNTADLWVF